jgi:hypothetical protein
VRTKLLIALIIKDIISFKENENTFA